MLAVAICCYYSYLLLIENLFLAITYIILTIFIIFILVSFVSLIFLNTSNRKIIKNCFNKYLFSYLDSAVKLKIFSESDKMKYLSFIDEIEALAPSRNFIASGEVSTQITELLQQLNDIAERGIFVIAATNEPEKIDEAIKRVGRFDKTIFVPPPDAEAREEFMKKSLDGKYIESNINYKKLAELTEYFTIAELEKLVIRESALIASKTNSKISEEILIKCIRKAKPNLNEEIVEHYRQKLNL